MRTYVILFLLGFFLSGCSSIRLSEYQQGCYDGLSTVDFGQKDLTENYANNVCSRLEHQRLQRERASAREVGGRANRD